ncbi:MAG: GNAT family N-acetyltransferase [Solobacterium sp.]|nr:GNAT family N-acetyltransferase [Solobacterium sp.]
METIRRAEKEDLARIAEIYVFNYRMNFWPVFQNDAYYFDELQVPSVMETMAQESGTHYVYDDGTVKGFVTVNGTEIRHLFVEPVLQGRGIGAALLEFAMKQCRADHLWALEKNVRAIRFYERHGFAWDGTRKKEEGTDEYLLHLVCRK